MCVFVCVREQALRKPVITSTSHIHTATYIHPTRSHTFKYKV